MRSLFVSKNCVFFCFLSLVHSFFLLKKHEKHCVYFTCIWNMLRCVIADMCFVLWFLLLNLYYVRLFLFVFACELLILLLSRKKPATASNNEWMKEMKEAKRKRNYVASETPFKVFMCEFDNIIFCASCFLERKKIAQKHSPNENCNAQPINYTSCLQCASTLDHCTVQ